jgi:D-alanyl-D-alanine carboxypeptidase
MHPRADRIAAILNRLVPGQSPGVQYVAVTADGIWFRGVAGVQQMGQSAPIDDTTHFAVYSLTKVFTAVAILQLVDQGRCHLDDPLTRWIPQAEFAHPLLSRHPLRLSHLIDQTSGIANPLPTRWVHAPDDPGDRGGWAALAPILARHRRLAEEPGRRYRYSNLSYWLLGLVIEAITGTAYPEAIQKSILEPLGIQGQATFAYVQDRTYAEGHLRRWSMLDWLKFWVADRRFWADAQGGYLRICRHLVDGPSFGGLLTTASALGIFLQDQLRPVSRLLSPERRRLLLAPRQGNDGQPIPMSLGWHVETRDGRQMLRKEGGGMGFRAEMRLYPQHGVGTVLLANNAVFPVRSHLTHLDSLLFEKD